MYWICQIISNENTAQILLSISIAILTIFIPIAISLFETNRDSEFLSLDRAVILDKLVNGPCILWELSFLFIPIIFWSVDDAYVRVIILVLWIFGIYFAVEKLKNVYNWIRGNRFHYRFSYLNESVINNEAEDLWRSVWQAKEINRANENIFFKIFKQKVNTAYDKNEIKQLQTILKLIQDFEILINKRDIFFLTSKEDVFPELLKWHYISWKQEYSYITNRDNINMFGVYNSISNILDQIIIKILARSINSNFPYGFFKLIEEHLQKHKDDKITKDDKEFYYLESFLSVFYSKFFDLINKSDKSYDIWRHNFPEFLKITEENLKKPFARITLKYYIEWATNKIRGSENTEYDGDLENVTSNIFPEVEPIFWSIMLTLLMRSWGENRIKSLIDTPRKFGYIGRIYSWSGSLGEEKIDTTAIFQTKQEDQLNYSINFLCKIFKNEFSLKKIEEYINDLKKISYPDDDKKESYRKQVLEYMILIKSYYEKLL